MADSLSTENRTPASGEARPTGRHQNLRGHLGTWGIAATVFGYAAPIGAAAGYVPLIVGYGNGLGAPLLYVVCAAFAALFAVGFLALVRHVPRPGAFYTYISETLGKRFGLGAGLVTLGIYVNGGVLFWIFGGLAADNLFLDLFGVDLPWWLYAVVGVLIVATVSYRGVDLNAKVLGIVVAFEFGVIILFDLVTAFTGGETGHTAAPFTWDAITGGSVAVAFLFGMGIFAGFESTAIYREEARDPNRTIPRATFVVIGGLALFYSVTAYAFIIALGPDNAVTAAATDPAASFTAALSNTFGGTTQKLIAALIVTSVVASELAVANVISRYIYNFSVDRVLPRTFDAVHPRHGSPYKAAVATTVLILFFLGLVAVTGIDATLAYATMSGVGILLIEGLLFLVSLCVIIYFRRNPGTGEPIWKVVLAPLVALAAYAWLIWYGISNITLLLAVPTRLTTILWIVFGLLFVAGVAYASYAAKNKPDTFARIGRNVD